MFAKKPLISRRKRNYPEDSFANRLSLYMDALGLSMPMGISSGGSKPLAVYSFRSANGSNVDINTNSASYGIIYMTQAQSGTSILLPGQSFLVGPNCTDRINIGIVSWSGGNSGGSTVGDILWSGTTITITAKSNSSLSGTVALFS